MFKADLSLSVRENVIARIVPCLPDYEAHLPLTDDYGKRAIAHKAEATRLLLNWPELHPMLVPCWDWRGGTTRGRPSTVIPPHKQKHPVAYFYYPSATRKLCETPLCVNPFHFIPTTKEPSPLQHPFTSDAEEALEGYVDRIKSMTLNQAMGITQDTLVPPEFCIAAFRNIVQLDRAIRLGPWRRPAAFRRKYRDLRTKTPRSLSRPPPESTA